MAVTELKLVNSREHDLVIRDLEGGSVKELEAVCRKRLTAWQSCTSGAEQSCEPSEKIAAAWPMLSDCHVVPAAPSEISWP